MPQVRVVRGTAVPGRDASYNIRDAAIVADTLTVRVSYAGGCEDHAFELTGWADFTDRRPPVPVRVALTHDAKGDTCKALVQQELRFDLSPLREAYRQRYASSSGAITVLLDDRELEYSF
jgi:hypothetical protein